MATASVLSPFNPFLPSGLPADHPPVDLSSSSASSCPFSRPAPAERRSVVSEDDLSSVDDYDPKGIRLPEVSLHMSAFPPSPSAAPLDGPTTALLSTISSSFLPSSTLYASLPIRHAFNWSSLRLPISSPEDLHAERTWYGVAFRSRRKYRDNSDLASYYSKHLYLADSFAHAEAQTSRSLLYYAYGTPHPSTGDNLATCLWTSRDAAVAATRGPKHKEAVAWVGDAYEEYKLERYVVRKARGEDTLRVEDWHGQEIGYFP